MIVTKTQSSVCPQIPSSFTGSGSGISKSTVLASFVCWSQLYSLPSKTYMWALKFDVFFVFSWKKLRKTEKSNEILDRAMSRWRHHVKWWRHIKKQVTRSFAGKFFGKSHLRNFRNLLWFRSYAAKSRPGFKFTPSLVLCVLKNIN